MRTQHILYLTLLLSTTFLSICLSELCHPNDKKVLLQIKKAFNATFSSWDPQTDCCDWYSIECAENNNINSRRVAALYFTYIDLVGPIPPQVGDLPYLETLGFHKSPNLTGQIPSAISKLTRLRELAITWTGISGPIPDFLGQMKTLQSIFLSYNSLTGPIPRSIGTLPKLNGLRLDRNKLTGPIPDTFGDFKMGNFYLYLNHNNLSGNIPASLGKKKDFAFIDLSRNRLEGDASILFGPGRATEVVDLSRNLFEFDFSKLVFQERLSHLYVNHNRIFGTLPPDLTKLSLQYLNVSYNRLCGKIPVGGKLQMFGVTEFFHNRCLCGAPLPECA